MEVQTRLHPSACGGAIRNGSITNFGMVSGPDHLSNGPHLYMDGGPAKTFSIGRSWLFTWCWKIGKEESKMITEP